MSALSERVARLTVAEEQTLIRLLHGAGFREQHRKDASSPPDAATLNLLDKILGETE